MSSLGSSRSATDSYRSFNKHNNKYINMEPLAVYCQIVFSSTIVNIIKEAKQLYLIHLLIYQDTIYNASFYAIMLTFIELLTHTLAEAHSQLSKKNLQGFVLNHQAFVADIYLLYNFFTLLIMQLLLSCIFGGLYNYILPILTKNTEIKKYYIFYLVSVLSSPLTSNMMIYMENIMDISREQLKSYVIKITDSVLTMIAFSIFLMSKPQDFTNENLYIILAVLQAIVCIVSYVRPFLILIARKDNKIPIRLNIRNFKPFRGILFARMLYQQLIHIISCSSEYINAVLVIIYTQQNYSQTLYYPNIVVYMFILIRQLTKAGKSMQLATKRFLEAFIESNIVSHQVNRIHKILTVGLAIHVSVNLIFVALIYIIAVPITNLIFPREKFTDYEYEVVLQLVNKVKLAALCIFANILTPYNQAVIYIFENKLTLYNKLCCIIIEMAINVAIIIFEIFDKDVSTYINFYIVFQCFSGAMNTGFFIIMAVKFAKKYNLEYKSYYSENSERTKKKNKKKESIDELAKTIAETTRSLAENNSLNTQGRLAETAFNNLMDGLDVDGESENAETLYGSDDAQTKFVNRQVSRKSKLRARQINIDDEFVLQKNSE